MSSSNSDTSAITDDLVVRSTEYLARTFDDGTPQPWEISDVEEGTEVTLPNRHKIIVLNSGRLNIEWLGHGGPDSGATRLWANSLKYLQLIVSADRRKYRTAVDVAAHYFNEVRALGSDYASIMRGSLDHQLALQLRSLSYLKAVADVTRDHESAVILEECLRVAFDILTKLELLRKNNHGIMLAIGLLHAHYIFGQRCADQPCVEDILKFLREAFEVSVDADGVVNENSTQYQKYWADLAGQVVDILQLVPIQHGVLEIFRDLQRRIIDTYSLMLLPNGKLAPIGDTRVMGQSQIAPRSGDLISPQNGLFIRKTDDTYLNFICGHRGVFHKQVDDTSISLWKTGRWLILDLGVHNYDSANELSSFLRSSRAHSGVYSSPVDRLVATKIIRYSDSSRLIQGRFSWDGARLYGRYRSNNVLYTRHVSVDDQLSDIRLIDQVTGKGYGEWYSRFLLPPDVTIAPEGDGSSIALIAPMVGRYMLITSQNRDGANVAVEYRVKEVRGYMDERLLDNIQCLEVFVQEGADNIILSQITL